MKDEQEQTNCFILPPSSFILSKCRPRRFVLCVGARVSNLFHFGNDEFQLFVFRIKMRGDAYTRARTIIDDELSTNQLLCNGSSIFMANSNRSSSIDGVLRT